MRDFNTSPYFWSSKKQNFVNNKIWKTIGEFRIFWRFRYCEQVIRPISRCFIIWIEIQIHILFSDFKSQKKDFILIIHNSITTEWRGFGPPLGAGKKMWVGYLYKWTWFNIKSSIWLLKSLEYEFVFQSRSYNSYLEIGLIGALSYSMWKLIPDDAYTQSPIIRTRRIRTAAEFLGKFKNRALGSSNLRTTSKNLRTANAQIFKAKNRVLLPFLTHMYISFTCIYISSNFSFLFFFVFILERKTEFFIKKKAK